MVKELREYKQGLDDTYRPIKHLASYVGVNYIEPGYYYQTRHL